MKLFRFAIPFLLLGTLLIFFNQTFLFGKVPFPGDLLLSEYKPWRTYSFGGYDPGGIPNKAQYPDTIRQLYPWRGEAIRQWKTGLVPLWNPYNFSGTPLLANFQSGALYPLNIVFLITSMPVGWTILIIFQSGLSLIATYLFIRSLNKSKIASLLAAVSYSFSSYMTIWLEYNTIGHIAAWFPVGLLTIELSRSSKSRRTQILLILSVVMMLLAGHPQVAIFAVIMIIVYAWFRKTSFRYFVHTLFICLCGIGITGVQLIPGIELILNSARSPHAYADIISKILIQPQQLIMMAIPDFFGNPVSRTYWPSDTYIGKLTGVGIVAFVFAIRSLFQKNSHPVMKYFLIVAVSMLIIVSNNPLTQIAYSLPIPLLSTSSPTLFLFLLAFSLAVLSAYGFDAWKNEKKTLTSLILSGITLLFGLLSLCLFILAKTNTDYSVLLLTAFRATVKPFGILVFILIGMLLTNKFSISRIYLYGMIYILAATELFFQFSKFNPFVPVSFVFPHTPLTETLQKTAGINRIWGYGSAALDANVETAMGVHSINGYDPLYSAIYGSFIHASKDGKLLTSFTDQTRSDAVLAQGYGQDDIRDNIFRLRVMDLTSTKYLLDRTENGLDDVSLPVQRFNKITDVDDWKIYENLKSVPRAYIVSSYKLAKTKNDVENMLFDPTFDPLTTVLLSEKPILDPDADNAHTLPVIESYKPGTMVIRTNTEGNSILVLTESYFPGWIASIDGNPAAIKRANYTYMSVSVPSGIHKVEFSYRPQSFRVGLYISFASVILFTLILMSNPVGKSGKPV